MTVSICWHGDLHMLKQKPTCRPLTLSNVGTPFLPVLGAFSVFLETLLLLGEVLVAVKDNHGGVNKLVAALSPDDEGEDWECGTQPSTSALER